MAKKKVNSKGVGAPLENKNALKLRESDHRKKAYEAYCKWLSKGKVKESFHFKINDTKITWRTIETYIKGFPIELEPIHKEFALCEGLDKWETICEKSADGTNTKSNTASLQMIMRNKFGWDKKDKNTVSEMTVEELSDTIRQIGNEPRIQASQRSPLAHEQSLLDQGQRRQSNQVQDERSAASAMERSPSMQNSAESPSAGHDNVFLPPFP